MLVYDIHGRVEPCNGHLVSHQRHCSNLNSFISGNVTYQTIPTRVITDHMVSFLFGFRVNQRVCEHLAGAEQ